jgi:hypothetical protein
MNGERWSRQARIVALIAPGDGPHLVAPGVVPVREWTRPTRAGQGVADALRECLSLLPDDPERFEREAVEWHARWCACIRALTLSEAQAALDALGSFQGARAEAAARELRRLCARHGMSDVAEVLRHWIAHVGVLQTSQHGRERSGVPRSGSCGRTPKLFGGQTRAAPRR